MYYYPGVEAQVEAQAEVQVEAGEVQGEVRGGNLSLIDNRPGTPSIPVHNNPNSCDVEVLHYPNHST